MSYEDEIYHSGYLDGYYAGMELYHADTEMTEEEKARRKKRRRAVALGVGIPAGAAALGAGVAIPLALRKRRKRNRLGLPGPTVPRLPAPKLKRVHVDPSDVEEAIGWDFKRNRPRYRSDKY